MRYYNKQKYKQQLNNIEIMKQIKVTEKYWNSLSAKEQRFLSEYAYDFGLMYCKRIVTLLRYIGNFDEVVNFAHYQNNNPLFRHVWIIIKGGKVFGYIEKTSNYGISERIKVRMEYDGKIHEVWNNWNTRNPSKTAFKGIA